MVEGDEKIQIDRALKKRPHQAISEKGVSEGISLQD